MKYVWLQSSINANKFKTVLLTVLFPALFLLVFVIAFYFEAVGQGIPTQDPAFWDYVYRSSGSALLITLPIMIIWFVIAFSFHRALIFRFSGAKPITRKDYPEIHNIVENLCISRGLPTPKIGILEDDSLNAFATGRNEKNARIVFSRGIIHKLNKQELEAVAAHELTHIMNKDTLLMVCIIVVIGIMWTVGEIIIRSAGRLGKSDNKDSGKAALAVFVIGIAFLILGYLVFPFIRLAISRKREYLADAGSVELTKDKFAMISALEKISHDSRIESIKKQTVAAMCIETPFEKDKKTHKVHRYHDLLSTHPSLEKRIEALRSY